MITLSFSLQNLGTRWWFYISIFSSFLALRLPVLKQLLRPFKQNCKFSFQGLEVKLFSFITLQHDATYCVIPESDMNSKILNSHFLV